MHFHQRMHETPAAFRFMATCQYLDSIGYEEYHCRITGASMPGDCGRLSVEACYPRQALRVKQGLLAIEDVQPARDRDLVMRLMEGIEVEKFAEERKPMQPEHSGRLDIEGMTDEQLAEVEARILERKRAMGRAKKVLPGLEKKRTRIVQSLAEINRQIEAVKNGMPVTLRAKPGVTAVAKADQPKPRQYSPEAREKIANAARKRWADKKKV